MARSEIADYDPAPLFADLGDRVTVWDFDEKCEWVFKLVSSVKTSDVRYGILGREVSLNSPVGKALLGKCVGDVVEINVPDGKAKYTIRRIELIA